MTASLTNWIPTFMLHMWSSAVKIERRIENAIITHLRPVSAGIQRKEVRLYLTLNVGPSTEWELLVGLDSESTHLYCMITILPESHSFITQISLIKKLCTRQAKGDPFRFISPNNHAKLRRLWIKSIHLLSWVSRIWHSKSVFFSWPGWNGADRRFACILFFVWIILLWRN